MFSADPLYLALSVTAMTLATALRAWPRIRWKEFPSSDADFHRAYIELIRRHGFRVPKEDPRFLVPGRGVYPAGYHLGFATLGTRTVIWIDRFGGLVYDGMVAALVSFALYRVGRIDVIGALMLVSLYLLTPGLSLIQLTPRAYSLTARPVAELLHASVIFFTLLWYPQMDWRAAAWLFALLALLTAFVFVTSKFGLQNTVFIAPILAILSGSAFPLLVMAAAAVSAAVLSKGFFLRQLQGQFYHLKWFVRFRLPYLRHRADWRSLWDAAKQGDMAAVALQIFFDNPILTGLTRQLLLFVALAWAYFVPTLDPDQKIAGAFCVAAVPAWLLTSFGPLRIFGEAERYLEFAFPAVWFLFWSLIGPRLWLPMAAALGVIFVATYLLNLHALRRWVDLHRLPARREVADFLSRFPECRLLCLNVTEHYYFFRSTTARLCCAIQQICPLDQGWAHFSEYYGRYPYINIRNFRRLFDRFSADFALVSKRNLGRVQSDERATYDFTGLEVAFEN